MLGYIKGRILSLSNEYALIETASGIGFEVNITGTAFSSLYNKQEGELYTYMQVREDGVSLFGFSSVAEKSMFLKLISVSGVGPKLGITVLSGLNVSDVAAAIASNDIKLLSTVKGMGKKTAERIVLELREKISMVDVPTDANVKTVPVTAADEDAVVALMTLGYSRTESQRAIAKAKESGAKSIEDIIRTALQGM